MFGRCRNRPQRRARQPCRARPCRVSEEFFQSEPAPAPKLARRGPRPVVILSIAMARTTTALVCLAAAFGVASAQVATLTASNFEAEVLNGGKNAFVKFYAPWCASR